MLWHTVLVVKANLVCKALLTYLSRYFSNIYEGFKTSIYPRVKSPLLVIAAKVKFQSNKAHKWISFFLMLPIQISVIGTALLHFVFVECKISDIDGCSSQSWNKTAKKKDKGYHTQHTISAPLFQNERCLIYERKVMLCFSYIHIVLFLLVSLSSLNLNFVLTYVIPNQIYCIQTTITIPLTVKNCRNICQLKSWITKKMKE